MCLTFLLIAVVLFVADAHQCQWGKFGQSCERNCSCHCALVKNNTAKHCNKISGECSEGCIPGWCGTECKKPCSVNCLNKICNQHNGYCTLGCIENYKEPLCNIAKGCSNPDTCKRDSSEINLAVAFGSSFGVLLLLNVIGAVAWCVHFKRRRQTLGPLYTPAEEVCLSSVLASPSCQNCLFGKCDHNGVCTDGCEPGFADIYCQHPCQESCSNGRCVLDKHTGTTMCTEGCVDGFCYPGCKIPCPEGCLRCIRWHCENCTLCESHVYGESCEHSCLDKCEGYACSIQGNCLQDTCMGGRYGKLCNASCKPRYESCDQVSGHCLKCRRGLFGDDCQYQCPQECLTREEEDMFRCRSGCKLCNRPPQREPKKEWEYTDMEATLTTTYRLCVALIVITVTCLCLMITRTSLYNKAVERIKGEGSGALFGANRVAKRGRETKNNQGVDDGERSQLKKGDPDDDDKESKQIQGMETSDS